MTKEKALNDETIFYPIPGFKNYVISKNGVVKSLRRVIMRTNGFPQTIKERILKPSDYNPYYELNISDETGKGRTMKIHRLLAFAFIPNPENKPYINHKDGNKRNNALDNLEWCTASENMKHKYRVLGYPNPRTGTGRFGELNPKSKIVEQMTLDGKVIRRFNSAKDAADAIGRASNSVSRCCSPTHEAQTAGGYKWAYVNIENKFYQKKHANKTI